MSVELNKISLKQMGGEAQPQVDPQVMEISQAIASSVQEGQNPQEVVAALVQNQVDQQVIAQALMMVGMAEEDIMSLFEQIERSTQPSTPEEVNANPELLARNEDIIEQEEQAAQQDPMMGMAKSGIEIKPENRGKFTAWAKKRGMTVSEAANKVMSNKDRYTPDVVKMANFARNAAGWNKAQEGGSIKGEEKSFLNKMKDNLLYSINPLYMADDALQIAGIPANLIREGIEGVFDKGDGEFNWGDIVPDIKGTTILDEDKKQVPVSETLGIDNWVGALATDMALDPTTYIGAGIIKNLAKKVGKTAAKKLPKLATSFQDGGQPKGKFVNGVFIPDEDQVSYDAITSDEALKANLNRQDNWYMSNPSLAVMPLMPPKTVNPLFDIISTVGTVYSDIKGESSDFRDKMNAYKANAANFYDIDVDTSNLTSPENLEAIKKWSDAQKKEWEYQTTESKARADKKTEELLGTTPTFDQWLADNPDITNQELARTMYDSVYSKMFGGPVYKAQGGFETPGFNPTPEFDADMDGIPDYIDIDGGEGTGVPAYGTVDRPNLDDMFGQIQTQPDVTVNNPIGGTLDRLGTNPYVRTTASVLGGMSDLAGLANRLFFDSKVYKDAMDQMEERSGADYKYGTKMSGPRTRGTYDALSGQLGSEADRVAGYYMNFAGSPYSYGSVAKTGGEFKPHMMFDPKTGKGYKANVPADHERMAEMGYLHKDKMQDGGENLTSSSELPNFPEWRINSETSQLPEFPEWRVQNRAADLPEFPEWYINDDAKKRMLYNKAMGEMEEFIGSQTKISGAKKGGEVIELSQDMIAQLIAAGADIEIL